MTKNYNFLKIFLKSEMMKAAEAWFIENRFRFRMWTNLHYWWRNRSSPVSTSTRLHRPEPSRGMSGPTGRLPVPEISGTKKRSDPQPLGPKPNFTQILFVSNIYIIHWSVVLALISNCHCLEKSILTILLLLIFVDIISYR